MVRAGVVKHPREQENSGYHEIQKPPSRYGIIDLLELCVICRRREDDSNGL